MFMNAMNTYKGYIVSHRQSLDQQQVAPLSSLANRDSSIQPTSFHLATTIRNSDGDDAFNELLHRSQYCHHHTNLHTATEHDAVSMTTELDGHQRRVHGETPCRMDYMARTCTLSTFFVGRRLSLTFSADQIDCVCHVLSRTKNIHKLDAFLRQLAGEELERNTEELCKARALVAYHQGDYEEVHRLLSLRPYSACNHQQLQQLWYSAHYSQAQSTHCRTRPLRPIEKYRIRRRNPLPSTIWDGEETSYCFKNRWRTALQQMYAVNRYPASTEKVDLSKQTGLTLVQINNWFKNKRQREHHDNDDDVIKCHRDVTGRQSGNLRATAERDSSPSLVEDEQSRHQMKWNWTPEHAPHLQTNYEHLQMAMYNCN